MPHTAVIFDPSTDFEDVVDGLEAVTLDRRGHTPNTSIDHALQRALSTREVAASDGKYVMGDVRWHIARVEVGTSPQLGDTMEDAAGNRQLIIDRQLATLEHRWRLICRNPRIVYGLDDTITIQRATFAKGVGGAHEATWHTWITGLRARIQPEMSEFGAVNMAQTRTKGVRIAIAEDGNLTPDIQTNHRVLGQDGQTYRITGFDRAERIGELSIIRAEVTPWPAR